MSDHELPSEEIARLRAALDELDGLPVGHYRHNGFATPDPWVRQRDVRRIVRAALAPTRAKRKRIDWSDVVVDEGDEAP